MTPDVSLSVVVASYGRPAALRRCILALSQSGHTEVEAVVVADKAGLEAVATLPFANRIKTVLQASPNLAQARNDGIAQTAGDIVAFVDDDAVPEPTWAGEIARFFAEAPDVAAATGPVIGRNGISVQWGQVAVDRVGRDYRLADPGVARPADSVLKLHGTNMALRRETLVELGGFDPAFRFYLDDTDLALRLSAHGETTAWLETAQVHHAYAASSRRSHDRTPQSLHDIGASTAVFLRKHAPDRIDGALDDLAEDQRARLFRLARRRKLGPRDIERLMADLRAGISEGMERHLGDGEIRQRTPVFQPLFGARDATDVVLAAWRHRAPRARREAERLVQDGARVTLILLEPTMRALTVRYTEKGWWEHTGGLFGRAGREEPRVQIWRLEKRVKAEIERVERFRFVRSSNLRFIAGTE